jgi:ribosomal protein L5
MEEEKETILDKLGYEQIFNISKEENDIFKIREGCDNYFSVNLTKEEVLQLAQELIDLTK